MSSASACLILLSLVLCCTQARAGAWVQPHKGYYLKLSAGYLHRREKHPERHGLRSGFGANAALRPDRPGQHLSRRS